MVTQLLLLVTDESGTVVNDGDTITDFRGDTATLVRATRARVPGKSGTLVFERNGFRRECYDKVFNLIVSGILSCGCDHATVWEHGHRSTCEHNEE